jgi:predicted HicB family RNase H-like nuclease
MICGYGVHLQWSTEDDAYVATCPEFPGLSGVHADAHEALVELQEAMAMAIEVLEEDREPLPTPRVREAFSGQLRLRIPKSLHRLAAERAAFEEVSLNTLLVSLIAGALGARVADQRSAHDRRAFRRSG